MQTDTRQGEGELNRRFDRKLRQADNGCLEWTGSRGHFGHGFFLLSFNPNRQIAAHRFAWERANGPIPDGLCVLHHCDNPPCVNVDHLFLGTRADNVADMDAKGRRKPQNQWGSRNHRFKLSDEDGERAIRAVFCGGGLVEVAEAYGISHQYLSELVRGKKRPALLARIKGEGE